MTVKEKKQLVLLSLTALAQASFLVGFDLLSAVEMKRALLIRNLLEKELLFTGVFFLWFAAVFYLVGKRKGGIVLSREIPLLAAGSASLALGYYGFIFFYKHLLATQPLSRGLGFFGLFAIAVCLMFFAVLTVVSQEGEKKRFPRPCFRGL